MTKLTPRTLRSIQAADDASAILAMPSPWDCAVSKWSTSELRKSLEWAREQWIYLLTADLDLPESTRYGDSDLDRPAAFSVLVHNLGTWFNALNDAHRAARDNKLYDIIFTLPDCERLIDRDILPSEGHPYGRELQSARFTLDGYIKVIIGAAMVPALGSTPLSGTIEASLESISHWALVRLHHDHQSAPSPELRMLAGRLVHSVLHALADGYEDLAAGQNDLAWRPGPFSDLRLPELDLLACRHDTVVRRFGAKRVEKRFEQQLSLLFQSLGFIVVQTRTGTRTVDLVCISNDPGSRVTFLVEAKTSKAAYALPAKDERALRDYVSDIDRTFTTLPPLRFVLLVSHSGTRTLRRKLQELQSNSGKPIRFMTASSLGQLRTDLPGPVPVGPFTSLMLDCDCVVSDDFVPRVVDVYRRQQDAHRNFAEALLDAGPSFSG